MTQDRLIIGLRLVVAAAFVIVLLLNVDPHWFWPGAAISAVGMVLQLWASGSVKSRKLMPVDGAYLFARHPSLLAWFVYLLGLVLMMGEPWVALLYIPAFAVYALNRMGWVEEALHDRFGTRYLKYCKHVPRYLPRLRPYPEGRLWFFSGKSFRRQYGEIFLVLSLVLYAACYMTAFVL